MTWKEEESRTAFQDGKLIFHRNWPYAFALMSKSDGSSKVNGKFDIAPLPGLNGPGTSTLGGRNLAISAFAKNKGTALEFVKYMTQPEQQKEMALQTSQAPILTSLYDDAELNKTYGYYPVLLESLKSAKQRPQVVRYGDRVWAAQFHAEMDADAMRTRMDFYHDYGYFPPEDYARIVADLPNHDVAVANSLLRRFAQYCASRSR